VGSSRFGAANQGPQGKLIVKRTVATIVIAPKLRTKGNAVVQDFLSTAPRLGVREIGSRTGDVWEASSGGEMRCLSSAAMILQQFFPGVLSKCHDDLDATFDN
jgi:hypothetical protein